MDSIYEISIDTNSYNIIIINDFLRMFVIQVFSQFMYSHINNQEFLSYSFLENTSYILLSILVYWLVFNKILYFTGKNSDNYDSNLPHYLRIR
jgi:hypothetical protein